MLKFPELKKYMPNQKLQIKLIIQQRIAEATQIQLGQRMKLSNSFFWGNNLN